MTGLGMHRAMALCALALIAGCASHHPRRPPTGPWAMPSSRPWLTSRPAMRAAVHVSPMTVQTLPAPTGQLYFYASATTTALDVQKRIERMSAELQQAADEGRVTFTGPCVFVFRGKTAELQKPFVVEVGFLVADGTRPFGPFRVRRLEPFHCAAVTLDGPASLIDKAYDELEPAIDAAGFQRTDEAREIYLNGEGPDSPDDRVLVAVGVK